MESVLRFALTMIEKCGKAATLIASDVSGPFSVRQLFLIHEFESRASCPCQKHHDHHPERLKAKRAITKLEEFDLMNDMVYCD